MTVQIHFLPDDVLIEASHGEPILAVAARAGVNIPTGCLMGCCHACEVELDDGSAICACISDVPLNRTEMTINLSCDPIW
ncbi:2Fe-2S iron-sulfur cluster-binding protein [Gloeocapsa sp. PCC 73106]|uniref:2Fe-2S iron-sulfur cluster-binding protein n=1 Tax=Gloeocapsa sp. PCC 73106 TaxID=102232 RepID=UPI0002AB9C25|nr:2Fe-2S iron-sulfur cluster-binding protein [Gloeocapsa sp. PCC 73106]ELR97081.1 ferredoxin [Gloeocapsa sp. PCC 73106]